MDKYDYEDAVRQDLIEFIREKADYKGWTADDIRNNHDEIYDDAFMNDSVTGNASGSYTFNTWKAEECLCHNWDLMEETVDELGWPNKDRLFSAEIWDVCIRCFMLGRVLDDALDKVISEMEEKEVK